MGCNSVVLRVAANILEKHAASSFLGWRGRTEAVVIKYSK